MGTHCALCVLLHNHFNARVHAHVRQHRADHSRAHNTAPFTIITPSDELDKAEDTALLAAY